jgi:hypothetical protein
MFVYSARAPAEIPEFRTEVSVGLRRRVASLSPACCASLQCRGRRVRQRTGPGVGALFPSRAVGCVVRPNGGRCRDQEQCRDGDSAGPHRGGLLDTGRGAGPAPAAAPRPGRRRAGARCPAGAARSSSGGAAARGRPGPADPARGRPVARWRSPYRRRPAVRRRCPACGRWRSACRITSDWRRSTFWRRRAACRSHCSPRGRSRHRWPALRQPPGGRRRQVRAACRPVRPVGCRAGGPRSGFLIRSACGTACRTRTCPRAGGASWRGVGADPRCAYPRAAPRTRAAARPPRAGSRRARSGWVLS